MSSQADIDALSCSMDPPGPPTAVTWASSSSCFSSLKDIHAYQVAAGVTTVPIQETGASDFLSYCYPDLVSLDTVSDSPRTL